MIACLAMISSKSGEIMEHHRYLGSTTEQWDAEKALEEAKYVHFSDWPYPKPWKPESEVERLRLQPKCYESRSGKQDCTDHMIWNEIYRGFRGRRRVSTSLELFR
jgi:hypothetical protein